MGVGRSVASVAILAGIVAVVVVGGAIALAVMQDDSAPEAMATPTPAEVTHGTDVELTLDAELSGGRLAIGGVATVPDGALISYELEGPEDCPEDCHVEGRTPVRDGEYSVSIDVSGWGDGNYEVYAAFITNMADATQPDAVLELYGESGESMTGDTVVRDGVTIVEEAMTLTRDDDDVVADDD